MNENVGAKSNKKTSKILSKQKAQLWPSYYELHFIL